ncbi:hypothetical protein VQ574_20755 (plasmid) [Stutzerimonas frequens]|uniref:hypothetical protein n=1 Tax=Stutzerimonas frequens TaxID=2968969 RepID=UPI002DBC18F8|nr:hypothetical protein [Stutzerimonas frequens]WRW29370.1 hypothetical protein VQ574_20755 [Stutzerimonas frequens]
MPGKSRQELNMMRKMVGLALLIGLPFMAIWQVVANEVLILVATLLLLLWVLLPSSKQQRPEVMPVTEHRPATVEQRAVTRPTGRDDEFFGHLFQSEGESELHVLLSRACSLAATAPDAFIGHLSRLLRDLPSRSLVMIGETSNPELGTLLQGIPADQIKRIEISARTDANPNVKATLECSIWLLDGVIRIRPDWCARTANRADEIVSTLLMPLVAHKVMDRVQLIDQCGRKQQLPGNYQGIIEQTFTLAGHPEVPTSEAYGRRLQQYITQLVAAGNR